MHEKMDRNGPRPNRTGNGIEYLISRKRVVENLFIFIQHAEKGPTKRLLGPTGN